MKIKNLYILIFCILLNLFIFNNAVYANEPELSARAYFLIDNKTDKVLCSKNENERLYPASTTKILTALLAIENCDLNTTVTASFEAIMSVPEGYETADIQIGEQLTIEQLLEILLIRSSNDAANVLAEQIGGSIDSFVTMLNTKIADFGLKNTHFTNAYGLHDENHYTTAHDLACIMKHCLENETFRQLAGKASCSIPATNLHEPRSYISTNEMLLSESSYYYKYLMTGKTGFTSQAKECLVSSAYKDDLELIGIVLGSDNRFSDARALYEYGYDNYSVKLLAEKNSFATIIDIKNATCDTRNLKLLVEDEISVLSNNSLLPENIEPSIILNNIIRAPIEDGEVLGSITYDIDGISYSSNLIAAHAVDESSFLLYEIYLGIALVILIIVIEFYFYFRNKKNSDLNN